MFSKQDVVYSQKALEQLRPINSEELAGLYVDSAFLQTFVEFLKEQHWLFQKQNPKSDFLFKSFVSFYLQVELAPKNYLHEWLMLASIKTIKSIKEKGYLLELVILKIILERSYEEQKSFSKHVLTSLSMLFDLESMAMYINSEAMPLSMYRTF
ncbi:MAG TPA: hypothetical protein PLJ21_04395, partial [Pseudobdellovibrionaceae bacterium]|nr:hypothetical protein [Pseudobdellovibrionaceae bacterium]